ncbi:ABC transporter ATP-binding protein [bacterium]|nr:ABC transporter ATP-binding protein [bacterium]
MISIQGLSLALDGHLILADVSFKIRAKSVVALMGPSGCGKSTLLKALVGVLRCSEGHLLLSEGKSHLLMQWNDQQKEFALVPQSPLLLPWRTVLENILIAAPEGGDKQQAIDKAKELLRRVELEGSQHLYPWQISQGMAARVSLARTLMIKSGVLLLDEPFAAVDATTRFKLQRWLLELVDTLHQTAVLVTHDPREALLVADEILILNGKPARMIEHIELPERSQRLLTDWIFGPSAGMLEKKIRSALEKV